MICPAEDRAARGQKESLAGVVTASVALTIMRRQSKFQIVLLIKFVFVSESTKTFLCV